jgi:hypothetical protein
VLGDAPEYDAQVRLAVDTIEPGGTDTGIERRGTLAANVRVSERRDATDTGWATRE